jgi:C-terminal processing protease CtpA/Prc
LLSVDGIPIEERLAAIRPLLAYSTPQGVHDKLRDALLSGEPGTLARARFEGPQGVHECSLLRTEEYVPPLRSTPIFGVLPSGHGYMDLERLQVEQVPAAFEAVAGAPGLVFDLRGYPNGTAPSIAQRLGDGDGPVAAVFYRNQIGADGPGVRSSFRFEQRVPERPEGVRAFEGPVVVLIDERAISQAEHCCLHLKAAAAKRITFIGTPTNGTNGDVTRSVLPGGIPFGFTGHDVRFPDESQLQRRGIQPDILVAPTIAGLRAGRDEVLERAVRFLESGK